MSRSIKLSTIALLAAMLVSAPAHAVSLNLGGDDSGTLLDLGGDAGVEANVNVNAGDVLGSGGNTTADVNVNLGGGTSGSSPTSVDANVNLGGSNSTNANVTVNTGGGSDDDLLDLFGDPVTANVNLGGGSDANVTIDIGGVGGDDGDLLDLFGDPLTADVSLGDTSGTVDLFGDDGDSSVDVNLGGTDGDLLGGVLDTGDGTDPILDVGDIGDIGDVVDDLLSDTAGNVLDDLFGPSGPGTIDGGSNGTPGSDGSGAIPGGGNVPGDGADNGGNPGGGVQVAALGDPDDACFAPDAAQLEKLSKRHIYNSATLASWRGATSLKIVKIDLCNAAEARLDATANIAALQDYLGANPTFKAHLKSKGYSTDDVIAVDRSGNTLIVYVS